MKNEKHINVFISVLIILFAGCTEPKPKGNESMMAMDTEYATDKNVTIVHPKDTIRLTEAMKNFEDNPNITLTDIDAGNKVQSNEVQYVNRKDTIRLSEPKLEVK